MTITNVSVAHLRVLTTVVERGTFSAAAEEIGITQSGISQSIKQLEAVLDTRFLVRHRDGVTTTDLGRAALVDARAALQAIERLRQSAAKGLQSGHVRIGSVSSVAARLLPGSLAEFRRLYPGISVDLIEGSDSEVCEWVENKIVDLGLSGETTPTLLPTVIAKDDFALVVGSKHILAKRRGVRLSDLKHEPFRMSTSGCEPAIRRLFKKAKIDPSIAFRVRDPAALTNLVAQGLGVTIMPRLAIPAGTRSVVCLPIEPRQARRIVALTQKSHNKMPAIDLLLAMFVAPRRSVRSLIGSPRRRVIVAA
jgi:DNA-binding transcriptional LysR family regulator